MSTTPRTVQHVAPVPGSDVEAQLSALTHLAGLGEIAEHLASIDRTARRAAVTGTVAAGIVAGAAAVATVALVIGEVRR